MVSNIFLFLTKKRGITFLHSKDGERSCCFSAESCHWWWERNCREATSSVLIALLLVVTRLYWAWLPWPLTYDLDLWSWPRYLQAWPTCQNLSLYVRLFGQDSETDGHTDTHTDDAKTITPSADAGCKYTNVMFRVWMWWWFWTHSPWLPPPPSRWSCSPPDPQTSEQTSYYRLTTYSETWSKCW